MSQRIIHRISTACLALALAACGTLQSTQPSTPRSIPRSTPASTPQSTPPSTPQSPAAGAASPRERAPVASVFPRTDRSDETEQVGALIAYSRWLATARAEEQRRELNSVNQIFARDTGAYTRVKLALLLSVPGSGFADEGRAVALLEPLTGGPAGAAGTTAAPLREFAFLLHTQLGERVREQKRSAQLREQLDALKAIERSLIERGLPQKK